MGPVCPLKTSTRASPSHSRRPTSSITLPRTAFLAAECCCVGLLEWIGDAWLHDWSAGKQGPSRSPWPPCCSGGVRSWQRNAACGLSRMDRRCTAPCLSAGKPRSSRHPWRPRRSGGCPNRSNKGATGGAIGPDCRLQNIEPCIQYPFAKPHKQYYAAKDGVRQGRQGGRDGPHLSAEKHRLVHRPSIRGSPQTALRCQERTPPAQTKGASLTA